MIKNIPLESFVISLERLPVLLLGDDDTCLFIGIQLKGDLEKVC
jgi:hypothetical protein